MMVWIQDMVVPGDFNKPKRLGQTKLMVRENQTYNGKKKELMVKRSQEDCDQENDELMVDQRDNDEENSQVMV